MPFGKKGGIGGGGGVQSVTGEGVDNADPANPIIIDKSYFIASTESTVSINADPSSPSFLTGLIASSNTENFTVSAVDGSVINNTGRTIK